MTSAVVYPLLTLSALSLLLPVAGAAQTSDDEELEEIVVIGLREQFGSGLGRAEYTIGAEDIAARPGGAEITQALAKIPGVQVSTGDARGGSFSFEVYLRGLNDQQIGLSIDGIPAGDARFNGGSPPNRFVESSNVGQIAVSQSSGEIGAPSRSALGGFINFVTADPSDEFGVSVEAAGGDFDYRRAFLRVDSGELAPGLTGYLSMSSQSNEIYTGPVYRDKDRDHLELKLLKEFSGGSSVRFRYAYNELDDNDFGIVSLGDFRNDPRSDTVNDVFTGDPSIDGSFTGFGGALGGTREDVLTYLNANLVFSDTVQLTISPYYQQLDGESFAYQDDAIVTASGDPRDQNTTNITTDANGNPVADMRVTPRDRERFGATAELAINDVLEVNDLRIGLWTERDETNENRNFFRVNDPRTGIGFSRNALNYIAYERDVETTTNHFYIQDSLSLLDDRLGIDIGFTWHDIEYDYGSPIEFAGRNVIDAETDGLDAKIAFVYRLSDELEVFASYSENFGGIFEDVFLGSSNAIDPETIEPERSENVDIGIRYVSDAFAVALQAYQIDFNNRLTTGPTMIDPNRIDDVINGNSATQVLNQGGVESRGAELTGAWSGDAIDFYATYAYQESEWQADDPAQGIIAGVPVQDIPTHSFFGEIGWRPVDAFRLALTANYTGTRVGGNIFVPGFCNPFFCFDANGNGVNGGQFLELQEIPSHLIVGLVASYDAGSIAGIDNLSFQLNVDNVLDETFVSAVTGATSTLPEFGVIGGLSAESALDRYFIGYPRTVTFSVRAEF